MGPANLTVEMVLTQEVERSAELRYSTHMHELERNITCDDKYRLHTKGEVAKSLGNQARGVLVL